jgi:glucose-1-phosphate cytidylyltransferase
LLVHENYARLAPWPSGAEDRVRFASARQPERPRKVAILAGGLGSRLVEETRSKSKAMIPVGDRPILWHLLRYYAHFGLTEFVVALGYQGDSVRAFFAEAGFRRAPPAVAGPDCQRWVDDTLTVDLVETGPTTQNGGRIKRLAPYVGGGTFMLTWCDGLADVDLDRLIAFHRSHGRLATLTAVHPPGRFGRLALVGERVCSFDEKAIGADEWINGAFFVLEPAVLDRIAGDDTQFERETLRTLAEDGELMAFRHDRFWHCMDTLKEAEDLNALWRSGAAPWKVWE